MSAPVIAVTDLSKRYRLGQLNARTLREEVEGLFRGRRERQEGEQDFWALRGVSFEVFGGEVLGVVGRNGAGKSTLLKLLSRVTQPTTGEVRIRGRVTSLLEVGTGFHPELTGRENIFLNGAILGMTRAEIRRKFDEIVAFAEVEKFLDTPVKRYSSGMYVRLAFSVAAHLEPEILIIDEVLAVGDAEFQQKCLGKMKSVAKGGERTVLFVSHNMAAMNSLCDRAILLNAGQIELQGKVDAVTSAYLVSGRSEKALLVQEWLDAAAPGDDRIRLTRAQIVGVGRSDNQIDRLDEISVEIDYVNHVPGARLVAEVVVNGADGGVVFHSLSSEEEAIGVSAREVGRYRTTCIIPDGLLNEGLYHIDIHFMHGSMSVFTSFPSILWFSVSDHSARVNSIYFGRYLGNVHPKLRWTEEKVGAL